MRPAPRSTSTGRATCADRPRAAGRVARLLGALGGRGGRDVEAGSLDLARLVGLEDVAFLQGLEGLEHDYALEPGLDLADVLLEALEARHRRVVDDGAVAHDPDARVPADDAVRDVAAGDDTEARGPKERAHLGLAQGLLDRLRREHADESLLDVLGELVDDPVGAHVHALALGELLRLGVGTNVEAGDDRVRGRRQHDVRLRDRADPRVDDVDLHLRVSDLPELAQHGLDRALNVGLDDDVELLDAALLQPREEFLQGDALLRAAGELLGAPTLSAQTREVAGLALVLDDAPVLTGPGRLVEAEDL